MCRLFAQLNAMESSNNDGFRQCYDDREALYENLTVSPPGGEFTPVGSDTEMHGIEYCQQGKSRFTKTFVFTMTC